jgi:hypothetical protein
MSNDQIPENHKGQPLLGLGLSEGLGVLVDRRAALRELEDSILYLRRRLSAECPPYDGCFQTCSDALTLIEQPPSMGEPIRIQACRPEDRVFLATPIGVELAMAGVKALIQATQPPACRAYPDQPCVWPGHCDDDDVCAKRTGLA